ncbi:hypothetical protein GE09DRAFT_338696 [Coniochaeta sp. 2T2.1]|nr:hypothetical protein GE09DRAFT_338696 [Coniochaeta sp. 2T2.1]
MVCCFAPSRRRRTSSLLLCLLSASCFLVSHGISQPMSFNIMLFLSIDDNKSCHEALVQKAKLAQLTLTPKQYINPNPFHRSSQPTPSTPRTASQRNKTKPSRGKRSKRNWSHWGLNPRPSHLLDTVHPGRRAVLVRRSNQLSYGTG